jgi:hypothetical protein
MPILDTHALPIREPKPGWHGRFFGSQSMTFAYYEIDGGASLHEHSHANEEVWNVLSGELEVTIAVDEGVRDEVGGGNRAALSVERCEADGDLLALEIRNHGRERGVVRRIDLELGRAATLPAPTRTEIPAGELPELEPIAGLATLRREYPTEGRPVTWLRGAIFYEDARGDRHHTTLCRVLDAERRYVSPARPGYNYGS